MIHGEPVDAVTLDNHRRVSGDAIFANITARVEVVSVVFCAQGGRHEHGESKYSLVRETHIIESGRKAALCKVPGLLQVTRVDVPFFDCFDVEVLDGRSGAVTRNRGCRCRSGHFA